MSEQPYDFTQAKVAVQRASRERRDAEAKYVEAVKTKAHAERVYRSVLARAVIEERVEHGATLADSVARGRRDVSEAKEQATINEGLERAALERLRLCSEDRQSLTQLIAWSRQISESVDGA